MSYLSWESPITAELIYSSSIRFVALSTLDGHVLVQEQRSDGKGYLVLDGEDVNAGVDVRTRVHEYGGACATLVSADCVVFSSFEGPLYVSRLSGGVWEAKQLTDSSAPLRFADLSASGNVVLAIKEDHTYDEPAKVVNSLCAVDIATGAIRDLPLPAGDFFSAPRVSPSGKHLAYLSWNHPDMPWEGAQLYVAPWPAATNPTRIAGAADTISVSGPAWATSEDRLFFFSDKENYMHLYSSDLTGGEPTPATQLTHYNFDLAPPDWMLGYSFHCSFNASQWIFASRGGDLVVLDISTGATHDVVTPFASIDAIRQLGDNSFAALVSYTHKSSEFVKLTVSADYALTTTVVKKASTHSVDTKYISVGEDITYPTTDDKIAHAVFYHPTNGDYKAPVDELPPLVVSCHGGPTSQASHGLLWSIQYLTSRGFAFVDVDYGGSSGYGREYRDRLKGKWGIVDIEDTINCVKYLIHSGKVDGKRIAIQGGSAGGYTVLNALTKGDIFTAGVDLYGVADVKMLAQDTHKFESQYLFKLLGGTPDEVPDVYHDRSPINHIDDITAPLLILQGLDDKVVPPSQATMMEEAIKKNGGQCELILFEGEGHGFKKFANQKRALEESLSFYKRTWKS